MEIKKGQKYTFNTTVSDLLKYDGTQVEVIRPLTKTEADISDVGNMYRIRFEDGYENDAFEDELSPVPVSLEEYIHNSEEIQNTLEDMKKQFLPPVREVLDVAIERIEENKLHKKFEQIMQETLSADAVSLLKDPEEFRKWLERGIWNARRCDELARELDELKESIEECPRGFAPIPDYANIGDVFKTRDSEYLLVLSDGNLAPIIESSAPLLRAQLDNLGDSVELRNHEGIIVDYRYSRNK